MKISAATGLYQQRGDSPVHRDLEEVITVLRDIGFDTFDLALASIDQPNFILGGDDWERKVERLGNTAAKLGVTFFQSHLPFVSGCAFSQDPHFRRDGYREMFFEYTRRAYQASAMLGSSWTVMHPLTFPEYNYEGKASLAENHAIYGDYIDLGIRLGVGTAIENMVPPWNRAMGMTYCQHYDQLIELVDSFGSDRVGICWDTGHGNLMQLEQERAIKTIGARLKVLHISDNMAGLADSHQLPYMGDIDWDSVIRGLVAIDYRGTLNYESGKTSARAYGTLQLDFMRLAYQNGKYLLEKYEKAKEKIRKECDL